MERCFRIAEVDLARPPREETHREAGITVLLLKNEGDSVRSGIGEREPRCVSAGADDHSRSLLPSEPAELSPRARSAPHRLPVVPERPAIERMQIEQDVRKIGGRQNVALDAAPRANEEGLDVGPQRLQRTRDGEARIQMSAGTAAGEPDSGAHRPVAEDSGSVALLPNTRSFVLPMFTRIPVNSIVSTRFDRP